MNMKTRLLFLISFLAFQTLSAQTNPGIAVQGIARDAEKAALVDQLLKFTFDIQDPKDGTSYYKETEDIKTDPYGVFSHIIGTSANRTGVFNEIPFGQAHMKLLISVGGEVISNSPFQYTPYAKSAENGVPTGTIVAFAGTEGDIPKGWTLCDGRALSGVDDAGNLIALFAAQNKPANAPDLRGMFLRGVGKNNDSDYVNNLGPDLNTFQADAFEDHSINATAAPGGGHKHGYGVNFGGGLGGSEYIPTVNADFYIRSQYLETAATGEHSHTITAKPVGGEAETRPVNYGINYIIKL